MHITKTAGKLLVSFIFTSICFCSMPAFGAEPSERPRKIMLASTIGPIDAGPHGAWYDVFEGGAKGNAPTLAYANEKQAYTIMDRATYIIMKPKITLQILVERDEVLLNYMTLIPVNSAQFSQVNHQGALQFIEWLQGKEAQIIIRDFGKDKYGEPLFFPNSPEGKKL
jgi:tungstate transport system substrate-binding protein